MRVGDCPNCGAPVEFRAGAGRVKVCDHCQTVVLRGDQTLDQLGKVAELVDTQSPLRLSLAGHFSGHSFSIVGRLQKHQGTATWDEWYLVFDDGRDGWLTQSEGTWKLLTPLESVSLPSPDQIRPLTTFTLRERNFVVEEVGRATTTSAEGQLPDFNVEHWYADATGQHQAFCSLDFAGGVGTAFIGTFVTLDQLGFDPHELAPTPKREALRQARCPQCNGTLELKAPDAAKRVACPYCGALLDASHGVLAFLQLLEKPPVSPLLPLGREGTLDNARWTVLAFLIRSTSVEDTRYAWEEYLLWNDTLGFRWLLRSNDHWTFLTPIAAGEVDLSDRIATWKGQRFRAYQSVFAVTDFVLGECFWEVHVGEIAKATEYVSPPESINCDETRDDNTHQEVSLTQGRLIPAIDIQRGFALEKPLPTPRSIAPAQINPHRAKLSQQWAWAGAWLGVFVILLVVFSATGSTRTFLKHRFTVPPLTAPLSPESQRFSEPFRIDAKVPLELELDVPDLDNAWMSVQLDLVNEQTGEIVQVTPETSFYWGVDDGERWSEGNRTQSKQTGEVTPGSYVLRVTPNYEQVLQSPRDFTVTIRGDSGVGLVCPLLVVLLLLGGPLLTAARSSAFETERWNDAVFQSAPNESTFPFAKESDE